MTRAKGPDLVTFGVGTGPVCVRPPPATDDRQRQAGWPAVTIVGVTVTSVRRLLAM